MLGLPRSCSVMRLKMSFFLVVKRGIICNLFFPRCLRMSPFITTTPETDSQFSFNRTITGNGTAIPVIRVRGIGQKSEGHFVSPAVAARISFGAKMLALSGMIGPALVIQQSAGHADVIEDRPTALILDRTRRVAGPVDEQIERPGLVDRVADFLDIARMRASRRGSKDR